MTYGLGMMLRDGLLIATDTRTNAGVDHIATMRKLTTFSLPGQCVMALASAGNLATTQSVVTLLRQRIASPGHASNLYEAQSMFDAARMVGSVLREVMDTNASYVQPFGDPSASFLLGGGIRDGPLRLFLVYSAGNFIEASTDTPYLQIGEMKYGKPILDRMFTYETGLPEATKLMILSFDATMRSNLSVSPPIDFLYLRTGDVSSPEIRRILSDDPYFSALTTEYARRLRRVVDELPVAGWLEAATTSSGDTPR